MTDERRHAPRFPASLAGEIETAEGRHTIAITRDVSADGLLLLTRLPDPVAGTTFKLRVMVGDDERNVVCKVVRHEELSVDESTLWLNKVAVTLETHEPALDALLAKLAAG
jgi:hypothetical protein